MNPIKYLLSPDYRQARRAEKERQRLIREKQNMLIDLALAYADIIPRALREQGIFKLYKNKKTGIETESLVKIAQIEISADYFTFFIAHPYPIGVNRNDLAKAIDHVEDRLKAPTTYKYEVGEGFRFMVERRGSVGGVPAKVSYKQIMERVPRDLKSNGLVSFPVGIGQDDKFYLCHLVDVAHFLISGSTGYGKSNALASILCSLGETYSPRDLEIVLIDLKGTDLFMLQDLPQIGIKNSIVEAPEGTEEAIADIEISMEILRWMMRESQARNEQRIRPSGSRNLRGYNLKNRAAALPDVMIVIDELSLLMLDRENRREAENLLSKIAATVRSSGLHLLLCTQLPNKDVLPALINANIPGRISLYCTTGVASGISLGDSTYDAHTIIGGHKGRALFIAGEYNKSLCQTPLITDKQIPQAIERSVKMWSEKSHDVTADQIFAWILEKNNGLYEWRRIHEVFGERGISIREIKRIGRQYQVKQGQDGAWEPLIKIEDQKYILGPPVQGAGGYGRKLTTLESWISAQSALESPDSEEDDQEFDPHRLFEYSLGNMDGELSTRKLHRIFRNEIGYNSIVDLLKEYEGETVTVKGQDYLVEPSNGNKPRALCALRYEKHETTNGNGTDTHKESDPPSPQNGPNTEDLITRPMPKADHSLIITEEQPDQDPDFGPVLAGEILDIQQEKQSNPKDPTRINLRIRKE